MLATLATRLRSLSHSHSRALALALMGNPFRRPHVPSSPPCPILTRRQIFSGRRLREYLTKTDPSFRLRQAFSTALGSALPLPARPLPPPPDEATSEGEGRPNDMLMGIRASSGTFEPSDIDDDDDDGHISARARKRVFGWRVRVRQSNNSSVKRRR